ncbi:hypothetical protein GGF46_003471 [Coemansia sp. RSA 552]|nr:hypothetical protein GGF46_003471 [Coemansia sp. RSA 552]
MSLDPLSVPFLHSCERCRQKKRRCSGEKPACAWCRSHNIPCRYRRTMRFKKQLEGFCPPSSISALTAPVVLADSSGPPEAKPKVSTPTDPYRPWLDRPLSSGSANPAAAPTSAAIPAEQQSSATNQPTLSGGDSGELFSANALARLFSVDMFPQTDSPAADVLQVVNSYVTPFPSSTAPLATPSELMTATNTEASVLANLGNVSWHHRSPSEWMPVGFNDINLGATIDAEHIPQHLLDGEAMFNVDLDLGQQNSAGDMPPPLSNGTASVASSVPLYMQGLGSGSRGPRLGQGPSLPTATAFTATTGSAPVLSGSGDSNRSPATPERAEGVGPTRDARPKSIARSSTGPSRVGTSTPEAPSITDDDIPPILREYVSRIPGNPSAATIYRIVRETFRAPRMGMVSLNLELIWLMLHKGVLPRIVFYGHIASTIRCSVTDLDIKAMVPAHIDESCYELALNEVSVVKDCSEIWGAIGLCMIARYEFQSARYKEMGRHADMALDILHRLRFKGHEYPWHGVDAELKESFGFQYMLSIYWKGFWWKLMALLLVDKDNSFTNELDQLPAYSSKTYDLYTVDKPYDVDLMEMIPPGSWDNLGGEEPPEHVSFRGPNDPEFMALRPSSSPCFDRASLCGSYMQQLLVVYARFFVQQCQAKSGDIGLCQLLKGLWAFREHMHVWRNSLPSDMVLDGGLVAEYLEAIKPSSPASPREIDLKASRLKDIIMILLTYHTFLIRANRFVMKMMLGEPLNVPPPDASTLAFAIRDLYDAKAAPAIVKESMGYMNMYFHGCRIQAVKSANALCSIVQAAYSCKFNFYTLGSQTIFTMFEVLVVYVSFLGNCDENIAWRSKSRLSNVFNILRMLRHWAPALHIFVAGIKALSDPRFCLEEPRNFNIIKREVMDPTMLGMSDSPMESAAGSDVDESLPPKRRRVVKLPQALESSNDARTNIMASIAPLGSHAPTGVRRDETLSYRAADPIPEFPNPFPKTHVISLIISDLGLSLAEFLAPAYPILLLKLMPTRELYPDRPPAFGTSIR